MKKFLLSIMVLTFGVLNAQQTITKSQKPINKNNTEHFQPDAIIVEQPIYDMESCILAKEGAGVVFGGIGGVVTAADDFKLSEPTKLTSITVYGITAHGLGYEFLDNLTSFRFYILDDNGNKPVTQDESFQDHLYRFSYEKENPELVIQHDGEDGFNFHIDVSHLDIELPSGTYWLSAYMYYPTAVNAGVPWYWCTSNTTNNNTAHYIDTNNVYNQGYTDWTPLNVVVPEWTYQDMAMSITGNTSNLGISESNEVSLLVYPNPTTNVIKAKTQNADIKEMTILDLNGRKLKQSKSDLINVSDLASGVYIIKVMDTHGKLHQSKFIKK